MFETHLSGLVPCFEGWILLLLLLTYITLNKGALLTI